ncbi:hypothetical protein [Tellurirhabdus bombi]|uniref:hypothetical protein n=1 Tax=Tellurirhabdus bombi TaxID=2907205 RepID=UPI001F2DCF57|nr:hypothetical protein [Tellurirhabdus bombi]
MRSIYLYGLLTLLGFSGCGTGKNALKHGNFTTAVQLSTQRLRQKPANPKAQQVLQEAFATAYNQRQRAILQLSRSDEPFRWELVVKEYNKLQELAKQVTACPSCPDVLKNYPLHYETQLQEARELAAADRYKAAELAFTYSQNDRLAARDAVLNFQKADQWVENYRDARLRAADALYLAAFRVVIEPMAITRELSASEYDDLQNQIFRRIKNQGPPSQFVRYYMPGATPEPGRMPNHVVQMKIMDYRPFDTAVTSSSQDVESNQTFKVGTKKINDSTVVDVYEKVKGKLTTYRKTISARLDMRIRVVDLAKDDVVWQDSICETETWADEWQEFSGDKRALNGHTLKTASLLVPVAWQLYSDLTSSMASSVNYRLRTWYHDY